MFSQGQVAGPSVASEIRADMSRPCEAVPEGVPGPRPADSLLRGRPQTSIAPQRPVVQDCGQCPECGQGLGGELPPLRRRHRSRLGPRFCRSHMSPQLQPPPPLASLFSGAMHVSGGEALAWQRPRRGGQACGGATCVEPLAEGPASRHGAGASNKRAGARAAGRPTHAASELASQSRGVGKSRVRSHGLCSGSCTASRTRTRSSDGCACSGADCSSLGRVGPEVCVDRRRMCARHRHSRPPSWI